MKQLKFSEHSNTINHDSIVTMEVLGKYIQTTKECHDILHIITENNLFNEDLKNYFELEEDYYYIRDLINKLKNAGILVSANQSETKKEIQKVQWLLTNNCNLSCVHCCGDATYSKTACDELPFEQTKQIIDKIASLPALIQVEISGGEPLLHTKCKEIIGRLRFKTKAHLTLMTNALLIDRHNVSWIIEMFDSICISLDGSNEELTSLVRGKKVFDKVKERIQLLQEHGFGQISVSAILPESNEVFDEFVELCKELKVEPLPRVYSMVGRGAQGYDSLQKKYDDYLRKKGYEKRPLIQNQALGGLNSCGAYCNMIAIAPNGDISPCALLMDINKNFGLGNILLENNLEKILSHYQLEKQIDFTDTPCMECDINGFCWSCLADLEYFKLDLPHKIERCKFRKRNTERELQII